MRKICPTLAQPTAEVSAPPLHPLLEAHRGLEVFHVPGQILLGRSAFPVTREVFHQVREAVGYGVELVLEGLLAAALGVLEERHQEEGDDGGGGVDDELIGVEVANQEVAWCPDDHEQRAEREERSPAHEIRAPTGEVVEETLPGFFPRLRDAAAFAQLSLLVGHHSGVAVGILAKEGGARKLSSSASLGG
jgi:hypothetical protein